MNRLLSLVTTLPLVAACFVTGCGSPDGRTDSAPPAADDIVTVTMVRLHADGTSEQVEKHMTAAEEHADFLARKMGTAAPPKAETAPAAGAESVGTASAAITTDWGCANEDLWIYDGYNDVGNRLCFVGAGTIDLTQFGRKLCSPTGMCWNVGTWAQQVRSYIPGRESGWFNGQQGEFSGQESFAAWSGVHNVGRWAGSAATVTLWDGFVPHL